MTALAAVWHGREHGFVLTETPLPTLAAGEVLVRTRAVTLCGSDLHTIAGDRDVELPVVLGHEMIGEVVATGGPVTAADGARLEAGTPITWTIGASCGRCARCRRGLPQKCAVLHKYGHSPMADPWLLGGGLATHCHLLAGTGIVVLPPDPDGRLFAPANCATATVACAVRRLDPRPDDAVLITGCGMLGLTAVGYLRARGVATVLACDVDPARRALAGRLGATVTGPAELAATVRDVTAGEGVAVAADFSGSDAAITAALHALAIGGRLGLVGSVFPTRVLDLVPETLVRNLVTIVGIHNYATPDLVEAVRFLDRDADRALFSDFVSGRHPLERVGEAVAAATASRAPRVLVVPDRD